MVRKDVLGIIIAVLAAGILLGTVFVFVIPDDGHDNRNTTLRIGFMKKIDSLNPYIGISESAQIFYGLVYDALTCSDEDMNPSPNLAKSFGPVPVTDPDMIASGEPYGSVWQYNLTTEAFWSDGEQLTADDVVWTLNMNAKNYSYLWAYQPYAYFINYSESLDDSTVRVHFYNRETGLPQPAAFGSAMPIHIMPKHKLEGMTASNISFRWTGVFANESVPIVGTGPFVANSTIYQDWVAGDSITLVRNPFYHFWPEYAKEIRFDKVELKFFDDPLAMRFALKVNQIDVAQFPNASYREIMVDVAEGRLKHVQTWDGPKVSQYWVGVGIRQDAFYGNPTKWDPIVRHALAMATNKSHVVSSIFSGLADQGSTIIPPVNLKWHYELSQDERWTYDPDAAKELLEGNGYIDTDLDGIREATAASPSVINGFASVGTNLSYRMMALANYLEEKDIATYLKNEWLAIGVELDLRIMDESIWPTYYYDYNNIDMLVYHWWGGLDPGHQLFAPSSMALGTWNDIFYHDDGFDENYTLSVAEMDEEQRMEYVDNCQRNLYENCSYIVLAYPYQTYAWRTDTFQGWGDWTAHPARSLDNYWTANPLLFDLQPVDHGVPEAVFLGMGAAVGAAVVATAVSYLKARRGKAQGGSPPQT